MFMKSDLLTALQNLSVTSLAMVENVCFICFWAQKLWTTLIPENVSWANAFTFDCFCRKSCQKPKLFLNIRKIPATIMGMTAKIAKAKAGFFMNITTAIMIKKRRFGMRFVTIWRSISFKDVIS